jgi:hypothetical protein
LQPAVELNQQQLCLLKQRLKAQTGSGGQARQSSGADIQQDGQQAEVICWGAGDRDRRQAATRLLAPLAALRQASGGQPAGRE